jgi:signal transduction histidine kinase
MLSITVMLNRLVNYFIHPNLKTKTHIYYRAYALVCLNLFLCFSALIMEVLIRVLSLKNDPNLLLCILLFLVILFSAKKYGNLMISGNLMAFISFLALGTSVPASGGLYSDNLIWMIISPMIALLFTNKKSGFIWLLALLAFVEYQYYVFDSVNGKGSFNPSESTYYFISFFTLFIFIYGIITIFERGQGLIINKLRAQKKLLEAQQLEIIQKNNELKIIEEQLLLSNKELEHFAFVASHDMKEPLRMIGMYTQLTQKKLNGQLEASTMEYMNYVTDGVSRMQNLLNDLLQYSRLNKNQKDKKAVNFNNILAVVKHNLQVTIIDTKAEIVSDPLPILTASVSEMTQLFQNLIANSIKFRKKDVLPKIEIGVTDEAETHVFTLKDNGIGIEEQYKERIFNVFEKLHNHTEYEGSGIGLSTCRKIVQNMGGKIWIESEFGKGTTFFFTLPKEKEKVANPLKENAVLDLINR